MRLTNAVADLTLEEPGGGWRTRAQVEVPEAGVAVLRLRLQADGALPPPVFAVSWRIPQLDIQSRWTPGQHFMNLPPDWDCLARSQLALQAPVMSFGSQTGRNRMTFAVSDAVRELRLYGGVREESGEIACRIEFFAVPEAPLNEYEAEIRLDRRETDWTGAIREAFAWLETFPANRPTPTPEAARLPFYSTWYSYHQNLFAAELEAECALAAQYGMAGVIVDDGWQTDDNRRGYAYCGDWEESKRRFPDMAGHVARVHRLGLKYLVWFAVPLVGEESAAYERFAGKYLDRRAELRCSILDPRFPEVREYLAGIYERAVREWDIDGVKLDFIDNFGMNFDHGGDPAAAENYAGRDCKSIPEAVDRLLVEVMARLRRLKPEILVEFRQAYIGPAIRKYGNIFRAGDCPGDVLCNRKRTLDLRLSSGDAAVHSDMLEWNFSETAENAALQILHVLFSVPQISVRLAELPERHGRMLKFWLDFVIAHRQVLQSGEFHPVRPDLQYPAVYARSKREEVIAVYHAGECLTVHGEPGKTVYLVNAGGSAGVLLELDALPQSVTAQDTTGEAAAPPALTVGLQRIAVPLSGLLTLRF